MSLILIFADNGDFLVGNRQNLLGMIKDATVVGGGERTGVEKREYVCWGQDGEARDLTLTCLGKRHDIEYVLELRAIVWVITSGSDAMSKFRVSAADRAFPSQLRFCKKTVAFQGRQQHDIYRQAEEASVLHPCESWCWTMELVDALLGCEQDNDDKTMGG